MKQKCLPARLSVAIYSCCVAVLSTLFAADGPNPVEVRTVKLEHGDVYRFISLPGTIKANQQTTLYAKVPGYLKSLSVDKGDQVRAGQVLGEIEVPELAAEAMKYRSANEIAEADYNRLTAARKRSPDLITPQAVDDALGKRDVAKANLDRTEVLLEYSKLTAPFSGIVTMRFVDPGAFIPAATSGNTAQTAAILTLMDFKTVRAQVGVPESDAALVRVGEPVRVRIESLPGKTFDATVSRQSYALDEATRLALVEADLPNPELLLRPGMYATISLGVEKHTNRLLLPSAVIMTEKSGPSVFLVHEGKAKKIPVKIGFNDGLHVEILGGVGENDPVIVLGKEPLSNGGPVSVVE